MLLLANMLPAAIAEKLRLNPGRHIAQSHEEVSILFADVVGFTAMSEKLEGKDKVAVCLESCCSHILRSASSGDVFEPLVQLV
jgi:class 3 adenylate cyclase